MSLLSLSGHVTPLYVSVLSRDRNCTSHSLPLKGPPETAGRGWHGHRSSIGRGPKKCLSPVLLRLRYHTHSTLFCHSSSSSSTPRGNTRGDRSLRRVLMLQVTRLESLKSVSHGDFLYHVFLLSSPKTGRGSSWTQYARCWDTAVPSLYPSTPKQAELSWVGAEGGGAAMCSPGMLYPPQANASGN